MQPQSNREFWETAGCSPLALLSRKKKSCSSGWLTQNRWETFREKPGDEIKRPKIFIKKWCWNIKVIKTTQVLYGPEYTGLIQVKDKPFPLSHFRILHQSRSLTQSHTLSISHTISHPLTLILLFIRCGFGAMATGSLSTLMTGICSSIWNTKEAGRIF